MRYLTQKQKRVYAFSGIVVAAILSFIIIGEFGFSSGEISGCSSVAYRICSSCNQEIELSGNGHTATCMYKGRGWHAAGLFGWEWNSTWKAAK